VENAGTTRQREILKTISKSISVYKFGQNARGARKGKRLTLLPLCFSIY
jgi:hypothetical protein